MADATLLPWPDGTVDLIVSSPPYALAVPYAGGDVQGNSAWLEELAHSLSMLHVSNSRWGRLCLNVPLDRDLGGWERFRRTLPFRCRAAGWQFRSWILGRATGPARHERGSIDSAAAPNVTAPAESVLVFYRGSWYRSGPAHIPAPDLAGPVRPARCLAIPRHI